MNDKIAVAFEFGTGWQVLGLDDLVQIDAEGLGLPAWRADSRAALERAVLSGGQEPRDAGVWPVRLVHGFHRGHTPRAF